MTTKAQDAVIDGMADDGTVFVRPLRIGMTKYTTVLACVVVGEHGRRVSSWTLIAEDGATMVLRDEDELKEETIA